MTALTDSDKQGPDTFIRAKVAHPFTRTKFFQLHWEYGTTTSDRTMYLKRLAEHIRKQDWFIVVIELLVVIVGLMMAFEVDRWREDMGEKKLERVYTQRLIDDIESDIPKLEYAIQLADMRKSFVELLMAVAENPAVAAEQPTSFLLAVDQAAFTYSPPLRRTTFDDLRSTGNMRLMHDQDMKTKLHDYYSFDESQLQFRSLDLSVEFHHFELSNGILSNRQVRFLQDRWLLVGPDNLEEMKNTDPGEPDEIMAAAERLRNKPELVSWLSRLSLMQLDQMQTHEMRIEHANAVLDVLKNYDEPE